MEVSSLNHERRVGYGYAISLQIINGERSTWQCLRIYLATVAETNKVLLTEIQKGGHDWNSFFIVVEISDIAVMSHLLKMR